MADAINTPAEEWRAIPGFEDYEICKNGRIRRRVASHTSRAGRPMKPKINTYGYLVVKLTKNHQPYHFSIHCLLLMTFVGPKPTPEHHGAHWDGDRMNNALSNLRWATPRENYQDQIRHGTARKPPSGSLHQLAKLTEDDVVQIRERRARGEKPSLLAMEFGVSRPTISDILHRRTWNHV